MGFSQEVLAEKVGISPKYVSRIEIGQQFPAINTLIKLADALNVEIKDFFELKHVVDNTKALKNNLKEIIKEANSDNLKLLVKVSRAIVK